MLLTPGCKVLKVTQPVSGGARTQALTTRAHGLLQGHSVYRRCSWLLDKAARPASGWEGLVYTREERCFLFAPDSARNPPHGLRRVPGLAYAPGPGQLAPQCSAPGAGEGRQRPLQWGRGRSALELVQAHCLGQAGPRDAIPRCRPSPRGRREPREGRAAAFRRAPSPRLSSSPRSSSPGLPETQHLGGQEAARAEKSLSQAE